MMGKYNLNFKGYWREFEQIEFSDEPKIYVAYKCIYNPQNNTVKLLELIYIGKAEDMRKKQEALLKECNADESLCYSAAEVRKEDLDIVKNALVFAQQPKLNTTYKEKFNYNSAEFHIEGRCKFMEHLDFTINNNDK